MVWWLLLALAAGRLGKWHMWPFVGWFSLGTALAYVGSLWRHPRRVCRSCNGTGRHKGAMFFWADRACTTCGGSPRHRRWGAQLLFGGDGRKTWAERAAGQAKNRRGVPR